MELAMKTFFSKLIFDAASFWEYVAVAMTYLIVAAFIWTIWSGVDKKLAPDFIFEFIGK